MQTGRSCFARWVEKLGLTDRGLPDDGRLSLLAPCDSRAGRITALRAGAAAAARRIHRRGTKVPSRPYPRVSYQSTVTENLKSLAGGLCLSAGAR